MRLVMCLFFIANSLLKGLTAPINLESNPHWYSITSKLPNGFQVQALTVNPAQKLLYVAGSFNDTTFYVKRWDGSSWEDVGEALNGPPKALALFDSTLYIGGEFTGTPDRPAVLQHIARYDKLTKTWLQLGTGLDGAVSALCPYGQKLYIGGAFHKTFDGNRELNCITFWDGSGFKQIGDPDSPGLMGSDEICSVKTMLMVGDNLFIGGTFTRDYAGTRLNRIAKLGMAENKFFPLGRGFADGSVNTIAFNGSKIVAGGSFSKIYQESDSEHTVQIGYIAHWDGENWMNLGDFNSPVQAIITNGSKLYAAGMFTKNGSTSIGHIAQFDFKHPTKKWHPLSMEDTGLKNNSGIVFVNALAKWENALIACGNFDSSNKVPNLNGVAIWSDSICASCLYCDFTPNYVVVRQPSETTSCQALVITPLISAPFGVELKHFFQIKSTSKNLSWEEMPIYEMTHDTILLSDLSPGEVYNLIAFSECKFPGSASKSLSAPSRVTFGTRTVKTEKIRKTEAELIIGLEATLNPATVTAYYRVLGAKAWNTQSTNSPTHPNIFKIRGLIPKTTYEFKAGFTFVKTVHDVLTPLEMVETCIHTFRTK